MPVELMIALRHKPKLSRFGPKSGDAAPCYQNSFRVYRESPETMCVQFRRETDYMNISLDKSQTRALVEYLEEKVKELR